MSNPTLGEISQKLAATRNVATADFGGTPNQFQSFAVLRADARNALPSLEKAFENAFMAAAFATVVPRTSPNLMAEIKKATSDVLAVDAATIFGNVHSMVAQSVGKSSTFSFAQHMLVVREIRQLAAANGIAEIPTVNFTDPVVFHNEAELAKLTDGLIAKLTGGKLLPLALQAAATKAAEGMPFKAPVVPVVITGLSATEAEEVGPKLFHGRYLWTSLPDESEVNSKFVLNLLTNIKKTIKNKE